MKKPIIIPLCFLLLNGCDSENTFSALTDSSNLYAEICEDSIGVLNEFNITASRGSLTKCIARPMGGADLEFSRSHGVSLKVKAKSDPFRLWIKNNKGSKGRCLTLNPPSSRTKVELKDC